MAVASSYFYSHSQLRTLCFNHPSLLFNLYSIKLPFSNSHDLSSSAISTNPPINTPLQSPIKD